MEYVRQCGTPQKKKRFEWQKDLKNSSLQNYNKTHIEKVKAKKVKYYDIMVYKQI